MKKNRSIRVTPSSRVIKDELDESLCVKVSYEKLSLFRTGTTKMGFRNPDGLMQHSTVKSTAYDVVKAYVDSKVGNYFIISIMKTVLWGCFFISEARRVDVLAYQISAYHRTV